MSDNRNRGPLFGLKVIDLTQVLSGPFATMWLASMGAEVVKIENPLSTDITRQYPPLRNGHSGYFPTVNRNKKGITLNLKSNEGKEIFMDLIKDADVVVENFRPGVMKKLGLDYNKLKEVNPQIIYASISGYGTYGPYSNRPGYDVIAQAMSGLMYLTGQSDSPPTRVGSSIGDTVAGINIIVAILAALYNRNATGKGQMVETSLVDSLISLSTQDYIQYFIAGTVPKRMGNIYKAWAPYGTYKAKDGYYNIGVGTDAQFSKFAEVIEKPEMADDTRFKTHADRVANREEMDAIINEWASSRTVQEVYELMVQAEIPASPVNSIVEVVSDPHFSEAREMFPTLSQPEIGNFRVTNIPVRFSESGLAPVAAAPSIGRDNEEILKGIGRTDEDIALLKEKGVL